MQLLNKTLISISQMKSLDCRHDSLYSNCFENNNHIIIIHPFDHFAILPLQKSNQFSVTNKTDREVSEN